MHARIRLLPMLLLLLWVSAADADSVRIVATVPDLGVLAEEIGGDQVSVTVLTKGPQDPHFVEPRPSFVTKLHRADLFLLVGMDLEIGWAPVLLRQARNPDVYPGNPGYVDASAVIAPLQVPMARIDRSAGDVHPFGNPHYLTDPVNGLAVAALIRSKLESLRPDSAAGFRARYDAFAKRLVSALVGEGLVRRHGVEEMAGRLRNDTFGTFLAERGEAALLGGWLGVAAARPDMPAVEDHRLWAYFARRFGLALRGELEPYPGIAPTTRHLRSVVDRMKAEGVKLILASSYFDVRHARFVAEQTGARVAEMAHQVGSREGTDDYVSMVDYNVRQVGGAGGGI